MRIQKHVILLLAALCLAPRLASAGTVEATYNSATDVPVTANGYTATGNTVNFTLNFPPSMVTELMVVKNTGLDFIQGGFDNLTNGQPVALSYDGITYNYVANYYGGSGNDLVLRLAGNRAFGWGYDTSGQVGDGTAVSSAPWGKLTPVPVSAIGVLAGKTVVALAAGGGHSLAVCSDGTVAAWGLNNHGQLGDNTTTSRLMPVAANTASGSALQGKTVVAIAAGDSHSLALCSDGTVASWGYNSNGQLGDNSTTQRNRPVAVNTNSGASALYGKTVVAIAAGYNHSLALCSDGTVAAWGYNSNGQLGDNTMTQRLVPVAVNTNSVLSALYGKTVVAIAAGAYHSLALCSDGTMAAWGSNDSGRLGDNSTTQRNTPVAVNANSGISALHGKTVTAIAAGYSHCLVLCSDGTVAAWGYNGGGQLGINSTNNSLVPLAVNTDPGVSALYSKTVVGISAGSHSLALCSDGTATSWGYNAYGELGNNSTNNSRVPVAVNTTPLAAGERYTLLATGPTAGHTLALVGVPPAPKISVTGNSVTITNSDAPPSLADGTDFGSTPVGGGVVVRTFTIQNTGTVPLNLTGTPRVVVGGPQAADFTVTVPPTSPVASLTGATTFQVAFAPGALGPHSATLTITNDDPDVNSCTFAIQGAGAGHLTATYSTGTEVPFSSSGFTATGCTVDFTLNFAPATGTDLMVVSNTALGFIAGTFDDLTNGQAVALNYGGVTYNYVANYYGGSGNDLVLVWANNRAFAWGSNASGQVGDNTTTNRLLPVPVTTAGVLAGKTVVAIAAGASHNLALCPDGTVAAWGLNASGQIGNNTTNPSLVPIAVSTGSDSALCGKLVVAIAAGDYHSLALCSDGTVAAWGLNNHGQLGDNTTTDRWVPVAVNTNAGVSALYGKTVVALAAGMGFSLALCSDGTVAGWGNDGYGQLGDNVFGATRLVPVAMNTSSNVSALYGKTVVAIAAGQSHSLVLCSDGRMLACGRGMDGQLGYGAVPQNSPVPVAVNTASGSALYGKTVVAIVAGYEHSLALCSDGTLAGWGLDGDGQLGDNAQAMRFVPVAVNTNSGVSALYGKTVVALAAGQWHSLAQTLDGSLAAWGSDYQGQLGDNGLSGVRSIVPVAVSMAPLAASQRFTRVTSGRYATHTLALVAGLPATETTLNSAQMLSDGSFRLGFTNTPGAFVGVLAATNAAAALSNWTALGDATEVSSGQFQFTDPQATNSPQRFYRVRSP